MTIYSICFVPLLMLVLQPGKALLDPLLFALLPWAGSIPALRKIFLLNIMARKVVGYRYPLPRPSRNAPCSWRPSSVRDRHHSASSMSFMAALIPRYAALLFGADATYVARLGERMIFRHADALHGPGTRPCQEDGPGVCVTHVLAGGDHDAPPIKSGSAPP